MIPRGCQSYKYTNIPVPKMAQSYPSSMSSSKKNKLMSVSSIVPSPISMNSMKVGQTTENGEEDSKNAYQNEIVIHEQEQMPISNAALTFSQMSSHSLKGKSFLRVQSHSRSSLKCKG